MLASHRLLVLQSRKNINPFLNKTKNQNNKPAANNNLKKPENLQQCCYIHCNNIFNPTDLFKYTLIKYQMKLTTQALYVNN